MQNEINQNSEALTNREQRLLKQRDEAREKLSQARFRKIKKVGMLAGGLMVLAAIVVFAVKGTAAPNSPGADRFSYAPKIEVSPVEYDAGAVSMAAGLVKKTYEIKNSGTADLKIDNIWTSCHCTIASLRVSGKISAAFNMDGATFWSQKIAPGETGYLDVTFDPAYHGPMGTGQAVRAVYVSSNDPENKKVEVRLSANVTP